MTLHPNPWPAASRACCPRAREQVIEGFSTHVTLPEKVDLLVAEIVGSIASEEGLVFTMRDAQQRHLKRPFDANSYIPRRVQTMCAPASYVIASLFQPPYADVHFGDSRAGLPVRVGCQDAALQTLCPPQILEDFDFALPLPAEGPQRTRLTFAVDEGYCESAAATHCEGLVPPLVSMSSLQCTEANAIALTGQLSRSFAGLACWPR
jgi:hypothetical protein